MGTGSRNGSIELEVRVRGWVWTRDGWIPSRERWSLVCLAQDRSDRSIDNIQGMCCAIVIAGMFACRKDYLMGGYQMPTIDYGRPPRDAV